MLSLKMSVSKIAFNTLVSSGCLATLGATGWWLVDTKYARQYRIKLFLQGKCDNFVLDGKMLILKEALVSDIETAVETKCGVKILCTPMGSGKTTTVRYVLNSLLNKKKINGVKIMSAPDLINPKPPAFWFREALTDWRGQILKPHEKLSDLLPDGCGSRFVFVIDQAENMVADEGARVFMKTLAEDSTLAKTYLTIVICSDAAKAKTMWEWNGRTKIVLMTRHSLKEYRWTSKDIETWLNHFSKTHSELAEGSYERVTIQDAAVVAGTPGFLIDETSNAKIFKEKKIKANAKYYDELWNSVIAAIDEW